MYPPLVPGRGTRFVSTGVKMYSGEAKTCVTEPETSFHTQQESKKFVILLHTENQQIALGFLFVLPTRT